MDEKIITLIIGLAGIISTLISSGLGLYFIAKARSATIREALFQKQLELITKIVHHQERFRIFATILTDPDETHREVAREDIGTLLPNFVELEEEGAAILPTELWVEVRQLSTQMTDILIRYDAEGGVGEEDMRQFVSRCAKVALISRTVIGTDSLTEESMKLFSSKRYYDRLASLEIEFFGKIYDQKRDANE
jgi:hypothetical protein